MVFMAQCVCASKGCGVWLCQWTFCNLVDSRPYFLMNIDVHLTTIQFVVFFISKSSVYWSSQTVMLLQQDSIFKENYERLFVFKKRQSFQRLCYWWFAENIGNSNFLLAANSNARQVWLIFIHYNSHSLKVIIIFVPLCTQCFPYYWWLSLQEYPMDRMCAPQM